MSKLVWDQDEKRLYETGVEQVALFPKVGGAYQAGVAWNGVSALNITPSGAEPTALYANNRKYLTMMSAEETGGTIEAYTYPEEFAQCDGSKAAIAGVYVGQQTRMPFGLVAKTLVGNDTEMNKHGYKLHIIYNAMAAVSEKAYATVNESPEANTFSWEFTTTPVEVEGFEPTAYICIDSTKCTADKLKALEAMLYGSDGEQANATLPTPDVVLSTLGYTKAEG